MNFSRAQGNAGASAAALAERQEPSVKHTGQKRALLVGISTCTSEGYAVLKGAHKDVYQMRDLLLNVYNYALSEITVLVDDGVEGHVQPTRANILSEIAALVKDVKKGDRLFFHFSGHSTQIRSEQPYGEEDGLDECLIPMDGEDMMIVDNELHASLIQPLPSGSRLVAVLDTCHSGSLLDLKHHRCNRVYVPWTWRGKRNSEEVRNSIVRRGARLLTSPARHMFSMLASHTTSPNSPAGIGDLTHSDSGPAAKSGQVRIDNGPIDKSRPLPRLRTEHPEGSPDRLRTLGPWERKDTNHQKNWILPFAEGKHCQSPLGQFPCNGWCRIPEGDSRVIGRDDDEVRADVISLSSCKDSQLAWEADGVSMTSSLVALLKENPHQSLHDVLVHVSHAMYSLALTRHRSAKVYKQKRKNYVPRLRRKINGLEHRNRSTKSFVLPETPHTVVPHPTTPQPTARGLKKGMRRVGFIGRLKQILEVVLKDNGYDTDSFQNPVLSSPRPLDMNKPWAI
ncbi:Metacaspase pca1 [Mycena venus]|uniref:Metacaspase pca1 n=1 Tax=Mycena venus TaxID=2733690 RepID=A0A8H6XAQ6_9AGAR|nr:Metacaspase pca1 [Mycena venus]